MIEGTEWFHLTNAQMGIWYIEKMHPGTSISNISAALWFNGEIDFSILEKAVNLYIQKNAATRIHIIEKNMEPLQYICDYKYISLNYYDFSNKDDNEILEWEKEQALIPFSFLNSDIFHCSMIKGKTKGGIYVKMHHFISDAWTIIMLGNEISSHYYDLLKENKISDEINPSYIEHISNENDYLKSKKYDADNEFWNDIFHTLPEPLNLKNKKPNSLKSNRISYEISESLVSKIYKFCSDIKISVPTLLMASVSILLYKLTSKNDFVLGTLVLNRKNARDKATAGMFINTLPVRVNVNEADDFLSFANEISREMMRLYRHSEFPYNNLISSIREKIKGFDGLYEVLFSYQNARVTKVDTIKTNSEWHFNNYQTNPLSIHFNDRDNLNKLTVDYDYILDSFDRDQIIEIHQSLLILISKAIDNPCIKIFDFDVLTIALKNKILFSFNMTDRKYLLDKTIHMLFEEQVNKTPDRTAIVFMNEELTYKQLNERSNQLARKIKEFNFEPSFTVGLFLKRSLEMIIGILAVLKAGGAYLPIDPDFPEERVIYILNNSATKVIVTQDEFLDRFDSHLFDLIDVENKEIYTGDTSNIPQYTNSRNLAYVLYTSGSTGKPKGVMVEHKSVVNFIYSMLESIDFSSDKTILSLTTMSFDIFFLETILPLTNGLKVIITNEQQQKIPRLLSNIIIDNKVDMLQITPSRLNLLLSDDMFFNSFKNLSEILIGGEALQKTIVDKIKFISNAKLYNMYGPTETTIWSTFKEITESIEINIGKPIANTKVYVLDKSLKLLPIGAKGILYIGGSGLARGYFNNELLTDERFIQNPFTPSEKMYCTGDIAKWLPNGDLQYIGREDSQLKINGYRVELAEIDACLLNFDRIKDAATINKEVAGDNQLFAYYISDNDILPTEIRKYMSAVLPTYMVPNHFIRIDSIPLTPNGKIDRNALKNHNNVFISETEYLAPRNDIERKLVIIWNQILGNIKTGINDNLLVAGADSLSIISAISKIFKEFKVEIPIMDIYKSPTIKEIGEIILLQKIISFSDDISVPERSDFSSIALLHSERRDYYPLSSAQKRIFILQQDDKASKNYNMPWVFLIEGIIDIDKLKESLKKLVSRHDAFKTGFSVIDGEPVQIIYENEDFDMTMLNSDEESLSNVMWNFIKPFNLEKPPLLRLTLVEISRIKHLLMFDMHHIISDGESIRIMLSELNKLYKGQILDTLNIQYKDYSLWQKEKLKINNKIQEDYWMSLFSNEIPILNLPCDFARTNVQVSEGARVSFSLGNELTKQVFRVAVETGSTLYMVLLSVYYILLYRYTGQEDIVVGSPIAGRTIDELKNIVGMFVNTLALRNFPKGDTTFLDFLSEVKESTLKAFEYQDYQFEELVSRLKIKRNPGRNPLFDTMFSLQNFDMGNIKIGELNLIPVEFEHKTSKFDILLEAVRNNNDISLNMDYCAKLYKRETVERMAEHYLNILREITINSEVLIDDIAILSTKDIEQMNYQLNNTQQNYRRDMTINELFEEQVLKTPDNIAVVFDGATLTYKEMNKKANKLARLLRKNKVGNDSIVGIMMDRCLDLPVAVMSVLKAGGAYVPIDPNYPQDRVKLMLSESKANTLITQSKIIEEINFNGNIILIDSLDEVDEDTSNLSVINGPDSLIYVIYTSGSTGGPKGVMLEQKNLVNLICFEFTNTNIDFTKKVLQFTTISFDVCYQELFSTLLCGGQLCIVKDEVRKSVIDMLNFIDDNEITTVFLPPSYLKLIISDENILNKLSKHLRHIVIAGEQLILTDMFIEYLKANNVFLHNHYGPSETHVATMYTIKPDGQIPKLPPIGRPIANTRVYITDKKGFLVPTGVIGELLISGDCVGRGYLNSKELTIDKYTRDPFNREERMYKTGDLARWLSNGNLEFLGRSDNQVKIRGFRIELGEIESLLLNYGPVKEVAVIPCIDNSGNNFLYAYIVSTKELGMQELREYIGSKLPDYMVPAGFMSLEKMPMTPSNKINRKALPKPQFISDPVVHKFEMARNDIDEILIGVWTKALNSEKIGINDNFFELGGDSLTIIQIQVKLFQYNLGLTIQDFYQYQTIKQLSDYILSLSGAIEMKTAASKPVKANRTKSIIQRDNKNDIQKGVLLTGATGYLGIHILNDILSMTNLKVYCLVRGKNLRDAENRLYGLLNYYFPRKYDAKNMNRICVVNGDISMPQFGLSIENYANTGGNTSMIIHCAALVKHYGNYSEFEKVNITGVKEVIEFASSFDCKLNHLSTMGVSGNNYLVKQDSESNIVFTENDFNIGQNYTENVYIRSKFEAENIVYEAIDSGINASIFRIGNLTGRYSDGVFQYNIKQNAFYNKLRSFIQLGAIPDNLLNRSLEFTPVDYCSKSIVLLSDKESSSGKVFHIYNHNTVSMERFINVVLALQYKIKFMDIEAFKKYILSIADDKEKQMYLSGLIEDFGEKALSYSEFCKIDSSITQEYLNKIGFTWPIIDDTYLLKIISHMKNTGFLS